MDIQLRRLRKNAKLNQRELAKLLGVDWRTYGSWERGERMINLAQACQCADVLGCTVDEIAGRVPASSSAPSDPYERELMDCYRGSDVMRKSVILENARAMRERSGEDAKRSSAPAQEVSA